MHNSLFFILVPYTTIPKLPQENRETNKWFQNSYKNLSVSAKIKGELNPLTIVEYVDFQILHSTNCLLIFANKVHRLVLMLHKQVVFLLYPLDSLF